MTTFYKTTIYTLVSTFILISCNHEIDVEPKIDPQGLSEIITNNLNSIADKLRANQQTFHNREFVVQYGKQKLESVYGSHSDAINSYSNALSRAGLQNARIMEQLDLSEKAHKFLTLTKRKN